MTKTLYTADGYDWRVDVEDWGPSSSLGVRAGVRCCSWGGEEATLDADDLREFAAALLEAAKVLDR